MTLLFAFLIGLFAGLRALTPPAVTAWAVHFHWLKIDPALRWMGSALSVLVLTMLAITELIYDKRPDTPSRTAPAGLIGRIVTGGLCGACVATSGGRELILGAMLGVLGGSYRLLRRLSSSEAAGQSTRRTGYRRGPR